MPAATSTMPTAVTPRAPQRSAMGPDTTPNPKYRQPAIENTSETEPREAQNSFCKAAMKEPKL